MDDGGEGVDGFCVDEDVHADEVGFHVVGDFVVHGAVASGDAF